MTVPKRQSDPALESAVLRVLKEHVGKARAIRSDQVARLVGLPSTPTSERVRFAVRNLIADGWAVGSGATGFYLIECRTEFEETMADLQSRIAGLEQRQRDLQTAWDVTRDRHIDEMLKADKVKVRPATLFGDMSEHRGQPQ